MTLSLFLSKHSLMARPKTIRDEELIEAARSCFLAQGWSASTAGIAREAGVSEGTLFKRFGNKEGLFRAAMGIPDFDAAMGLQGRLGKGDPHENLREIALAMIDFFRVLVPRVMMFWSRRSGGPQDILKNESGTPPPLRAMQALAGYLDGEMEAGRLRRADPMVVARMLIGSIHHFVFVELVGMRMKQAPSAEEYVEALLEVLFRGLEPNDRWE